MPDNIKTQPGTGSDPDVRTTEVTGAKHLQHVRLDVGTGAAELQVNAANPLPANITHWNGGVTERFTDYDALTHAAIVALGNGVGGVTALPIGARGPVDAVFGASNGVQVHAASKIYGISDNYAGVEDAAPVGGAYGLVVRNIPSGTQTVSGTVAATQSGTWSVRNQDGAGNLVASATTTPGASDRGFVVRNLPSGTQTVIAVASPLATAVTGTLVALNGSASSAGDFNRWTVQVSGTYSQTLTFEGTLDSGTNWHNIPATRLDNTVSELNSGALVNTTRAWTITQDGLTGIRVRCSAFTSGTANIRILPVSRI